MSEIESLYERLNNSKRVKGNADKELAQLGATNENGIFCKIYDFKWAYQINVTIKDPSWDPKIGLVELIVFEKGKENAGPMFFVRLKPNSQGAFPGSSYYFESKVKFLKQNLIVNIHGMAGEKSKFLIINDFVKFATKPEARHLDGFEWDWEVPSE